MRTVALPANFSGRALLIVASRISCRWRCGRGHPEAVALGSVALSVRWLNVVPRVRPTERDRNNVVDLESFRFVLCRAVINLVATKRARQTLRAQPTTQPTLSGRVLTATILVAAGARHGWPADPATHGAPCCSARRRPCWPTIRRVWCPLSVAAATGVTEARRQIGRRGMPSRPVRGQR